MQSTVLGFLLVTHLVSLYLLADLVTSYVPWPTLTYKAGMGNRQQYSGRASRSEHKYHARLTAAAHSFLFWRVLRILIFPKERAVHRRPVHLWEQF